MTDDCGCVYMGEGEPIDLFREAFIVARKGHHCCECGELIARGVRHERVTGRCEGRWIEYRTCAVCVEIRNALTCDNWVYGALWSSVDEMFREARPRFPSGCMAKVETVAAKERLAAAWRDVMGLSAS